MKDPEIRDLQVQTARAYAIAERLAFELEQTVTELINRAGLVAGPDSSPQVADTSGRSSNPRRRK